MKTTKDNPAAFKKVLPVTLVRLIKKTLKMILNRRVIKARNFLTAEVLNYFARKGKSNQFYCNLCKEESSYFFHTSNEKRILRNSICPNCSSRKRHRGLFEEYKNILSDLGNPKILHFAPEPVFYKLFQSYNYVTADIELDDVDLKLNIQKIDCNSKSYKLILCNHVLEHVKDDKKAIDELERILQPSGILLITVPGDWTRDKIVEYRKADGNGHYRDYGLDFIEILKKKFTGVEVVDLYKYNDIYNYSIGLTPNHDLAFVCHKT